MAQQKERKRLDLLDQLNAFTDAVQAQEYLAMPGLSEKEKQVRLKKELQFAMEICTTLPSVDPGTKLLRSLESRWWNTGLDSLHPR